MKEIEEISVHDLPETKLVPDGFHVKDAPVASDKNIEYLIKKYNELVEIVNLLSEKLDN